MTIKEEEKTKFFDFKTLKVLNEKAVKRKYNRSLYFEKLPIAPEEYYPVVMSMLHNDVEIRCEILLNRKGDKCWLDVAIEDFNRLPEA